MFEDKTIVCNSCGEEFVFTVGEQEFYEKQGYQNEPKKCKKCRMARKNAGKVMITTVCAQCGGEAVINFEPTNDRPIYCRECFNAMRNAQNKPE